MGTENDHLWRSIYLRGLAVAAKLSTYSLFLTKELLLAHFKRIYEMLGIEFVCAACEANTMSVIPSLFT